MMLEMEKIEPEIFHVKTPEADEAKEAGDKLTREEMLERSRELRRLRIRESHKSAKAHHINKIKSKKYHRIMKREKMKQQIKEFELLQKTDPEAALRKIEQLDRNRIQERATLRHRNTGTWAQNLQVRAKYDKDARKDLADQIAISRELTAKKPIDESDDEDGNEDETNNNYDPLNPWLSKDGAVGGDSNGKREVDAFVSGYRKYWQDRNESEKEMKEYQAGNAVFNEANEEVEEEEEEEEEGSPAPTKIVNNKQTLKKHSGQNVTSSSQGTKATNAPRKSEEPAKKKSKINNGWYEEDISPEPAVVVSEQPKNKGKAKKAKASVADNLDDLFDDAEDAMRTKFEKKSKKIKKDINSRRPTAKDYNKKDSTNPKDERIDMKLKKQIVRPKIDEELDIGDAGAKSTSLHDKINETLANMKSQASNGTSNNDIENINPDDIAKMKEPQRLKTALPDMIYSVDDNEFQDYEDMDYHFDEEKKLTIAEAFKDDDIVAEFEREKDDEQKKNGPEEIDLSLPGWGSWSGSGINPNKQKTKRKMILRFPEPEKRRLDNQGNVVLIENRDEELKKHLVSTIPFPFTSVDDYEQSIRQPLGKDFVPATAHRVLTKPAVTTKSGTIIAPMNKNMLVKPGKRPVSKTEHRIAKTLED